MRLTSSRRPHTDAADAPSDSTSGRAAGTSQLQSSSPSVADPRIEALANQLGTMRMDRFANNATSHLRTVIADKTEIPMLRTGEIWKKGEGTLSLRSTQNILRLKTQLGGLSRDESNFVERLTNAPLHATHFTYAPDSALIGRQGEVSLYSRNKLLQKNMSFDQGNTEAIDLQKAGNDNYVFFSLECGSSPQKKESRFGDNLYRFNFSDPRFRHGWMSLNDMANPKANSLERWIPGLRPNDYEFARRDVQRTSSPDFVFAGNDMRQGLALSVIRSTRNMSSQARQAILSANTNGHLNAVINGLFRPEVKIPRFLITQNYEKHNSQYFFNHQAIDPNRLKELDDMSDIGADSDYE